MNYHTSDSLRLVARERLEQRTREADAERLAREIRGTEKGSFANDTMHQSSTSSDPTDKGNAMQHRHRFAVLAFVIALTGFAAVAPATAHDPNHVYFDESGNPCWIHSNDPSAFHWILADLGSQECLSTFASDSDWIYTYSPYSGTYIQSPNGVVCTDSGGCGDVWTPEPSPECANLTDEEYQLWIDYDTFINGYSDTGLDLTDEQIDLYGMCWFLGF